MKSPSPKATGLALFFLLTIPLAGIVNGQSAQTSSQSTPTPQSSTSSSTPNVAPASAATASPSPASPSATAPASAEPKPATPAPTPLAHALELYRTEKYVEATGEYSTIIAANGPDAPAAYAGLARVYLEQKKFEDAFTAAQKAVAADPHLPAGHVALGEIYFRQGKFSDAEREFWVPLKEKRPDARAYFGVSRIYRATSNYKMAKTAVDLAHQLDPADPEIRLVWIGTLNLKDRTKALQDYLATRNDPNDKSLEGLQHWLAILEDEAKRPITGCHLVNKVTSTQTDLTQLMVDAENIRGYGLKVKFNDTTARLLLDTGAGGIVVNSRIAEKAGIQRVVEQKVGGIGDKGLASGYVGYAESVQIGDLEFQNCYVDVIEQKRSLDEDGLIGADVFKDFLVDIDFPDHKFKLSELPKRPNESPESAALDSSSNNATYHPHDRYIAPEMQSYTKLFRFHHMLLIPVTVNDHPPKLFLIDTGAFDNTITPAAAREVTKVSAEYGVKVKGLSGEVKKMYTADDVSLGFANFKQQHKTIFSFDLTGTSDWVGTEVSGTLGFGTLFLLDMKIDYRDGLIDFGYEENRFH